MGRVHNISASQRKVTSKFVLPPHHVVVIDRPGIKDAQINTGFSGITPLIPEHYEIELSEVILGGPFKSRLNQVLREKQGLVYSISSAGQYSAGYGGFYIKTSTENKKVADVLMELEKQIDLFKRGVGIDEKDLNEAKEYIDGYFDIALSNRYAVAAKFFEVVLDTQQLNYLDRYKENIQAVSLKAFKAALQKYFDYSRFKTVVVGDLKQIEPGLKAKGIKYQVHQVAEFL